MTTEIVVDLETLGTQPGCVILSIGAVARHGEEHGEFYLSISLKDSMLEGCEIHPATHRWWLRQDAGVLEAAFGGEDSLREALTDFEAWVAASVPNPDNMRIYGKGPSFDLVILGAAYDMLGMVRPWDFWQERCIRTAVTEAARLLSGDRIGLVPERDLHVVSQVPHHALYDARAEMETLLRARERVAAKMLPTVQI